MDQPDTPTKSFDPSKHLSTLKGKSYMECKWRLVWLRTEHPEATIVTELVEHVADKYAVFKATVTIPGGGTATDYGSETQKDFADYLEKASTKSISRALALLGYGTQFAEDFSEDEKNLADSPVSRGRQNYDRKPTPMPAASSPATQAQKVKIWKIGTEQLKLDQGGIEKIIRKKLNKAVADLTFAEANEIIKALEIEAKETPVEGDPAF